MKLHKIKISLELRFTSKWHAGSGEGSFLVDRLINRDAKGLPYIPASTLKGVVRENCERLSRTLGFFKPTDPHANDLQGFVPLARCPSTVDRLFGTRYETGNLFFRDAHMIDDPPYQFTTVQNRVGMYRILGTAKPKHLFATEYASPLTLETQIKGYHKNLRCFGETDPPFAYCLLVAALLSTERLGGDKSTGKGNVRVHIRSIEYNGKPIEAEPLFDYLDEEIIRMAIKETA